MERLQSFTLHLARVSPKTIWLFVQLKDLHGRMGCGEATLSGREAQVVAACEKFAPMVLSSAFNAGADFAQGYFPQSLIESAVVSGIDHALLDLESQAKGLRLAEVLGTVQREQIRVYANINRRTVDRSPAGFAASARDAMAAGHTAFKIAPFDEAAVDQTESQAEAALHLGLARVQAVREAVGPNARLMVDCHWRFAEGTAQTLLTHAAELKLYWVECPLPETTENIAGLKRLRSRANALGVRLAGLEEGVRLPAFEPFLAAGAYDVVMPDVKYFGGLAHIMQAGERFAQAGVDVSPHNPSGPICHAVSLQLAAALPQFESLEMQFDESPLFQDFVGGAVPSVVDGFMRLPGGPGLGMALDMASVAAHAERSALVWSATC